MAEPWKKYLPSQIEAARDKPWEKFSDFTKQTTEAAAPAPELEKPDLTQDVDPPKIEAPDKPDVDAGPWDSFKTSFETEPKVPEPQRRAPDLPGKMDLGVKQLQKALETLSKSQVV